MDTPAPPLRWREACTFGTLVVVFMCQLITPARPATPAEERAVSAVNVSLYMVTVDEWNSNVRSKFQSTVIAQANTYCGSNPGTCGLTAWDQNKEFQDSDFEETTSALFPSYTKPTLSIQYALKLPTNVSRAPNENQVYLKQSALQVVTVNSRVPLSSSDNVDITYVGSENYGPVPDPVLNGAISAAFAALIIIAVIVLLVLRSKCSKDEKDEARKEHIAAVVAKDKKKPDSKSKSKLSRNESTPL